MITIGQHHTLRVTKITPFGAFFDADDLGEVLMPNKHGAKGLAVGDTQAVFIYLDSDDRPICTLQKPKIRVGEFALLRVIDSNSVGAFLDWGLDKDLLVPFAEQHRPMEVGRSYLVRAYIDHTDGRIVASSKVDKFVEEDKPHGYSVKQAVNLIVANTTDLGFKAIINHHHWGVLYKEEVFQRLSFGQAIKGYIKFIRPDGKIDLTLQGGQETRDKYTHVILNYLKRHNGYAPVHDKSDPEQISLMFKMSKKAFKKTIGGLYKQKIIRIENDGIYLLDRTEPKA
ncbi:CvfB family protein [Marinagarivorans algicola]|uniref:CvfB family protein n=1 Tax=Marinagarivorans algicola TaxID=1513270 RepID=UPI0006B8DFCD|nr:S1-like domain-containing RNA-binding protein [Marinagarivorans algicola]